MTFLHRTDTAALLILIVHILRNYLLINLFSSPSKKYILRHQSSIEIFPSCWKIEKYFIKLSENRQYLCSLLFPGNYIETHWSENRKAGVRVNGLVIGSEAQYYE